jgi:hypothetical protein
MFIVRSHNARKAPFGGAEFNSSLTTQKSFRSPERSWTVSDSSIYKHVTP